MDIKDFLKKGLLGTGMFVATASLGNTMKNEIDEIEPLEPIGQSFTEYRFKNQRQFCDSQGRFPRKSRSRLVGEQSHLQLCELSQSGENALRCS